MLGKFDRLAVGLWIASIVGVLRAAEPLVDAMVPCGAQVGTEVRVKLFGKVEPWPCQVWCESAGVTFFPDGEKVGEILVKVGDEVEPGNYLVRFYNEEGVSEPKIFVVGEVREVTEMEGNGSLAKPQKLEREFPMVVNGRLDKGGQADFFSLDLKRGKRIGIWVEGYSLQSPIDPHLHVFGPGGVKLAMGNDRPGGLDPELDFVAPEDGKYVVGVMGFAHPPAANVEFTGNVKAVYRLHFGEPGGRVARPEFDGGGGGKLAVPFVVTKPIYEKEERVEFLAEKGQKLLIRVEGEGIGSAIDGVLRLENAEGEMVKEVDDTKSSSDPELAWSVPADGAYSVAVGDRFQRRGEGIFFRLSVSEEQADYSVKADSASYSAKVGESTELGLSVERKLGHVGKLSVAVRGLPEGVEAEVAELGEKADSVKVKLKVSSEAGLGSAPFRVEVVDGGGLVRVVNYLLPNDSSRGAFLVNETADLWFTVKTK